MSEIFNLYKIRGFFRIGKGGTVENFSMALFDQLVEYHHENFTILVAFRVTII